MRDTKREEEDDAKKRGDSGIRVLESSSSSPKIRRLTFEAKENERDIFFRKDGLRET